jgi:hypothetical protein
MVAVAGIEPTSLDYQSSALPLSYTAMVDPTGLKPAPHGLKGRCSVTRAPGQKIGCGGRIRTFGDRINSAVPYHLGYATKNFISHKEAQKAQIDQTLFLFCASLWQNLAAATRVELVSSRLQDERSGSQLSYAAIWWTGRDSNPHVKFAGLLCCRYITSPKFGGCGWSRTTNLALMRRLLFPVELHSRRYFGSPRRS